MSHTIQNVETLSQAFVEFLEEKDVATFGQDLYINRVPDSTKTQDSIYWILTSGGAPISKLRTGEVLKLHAISIYYRSNSNEDVERTLHKLEQLLSCANCLQLTGFEVVDLEISQYPATQDLDSEDREVGLLQINIKTYKKEC
jgi:hypothetical protein